MSQRVLDELGYYLLAGARLRIRRGHHARRHPDELEPIVAAYRAAER
jgi:hypothetical protein